MEEVAVGHVPALQGLDLFQAKKKKPVVDVIA